jgi:4-amino-4-deoxy-L-arabinose transferase-like glycosyltransferase
MSRKHFPIVATLFAAIAAVHLWSLMRFPAPFVDEGWLASRAWAFVHTHRAFGPLDGDVFERFEGYWTFFPLLPTMIQSYALRLSAAPALFPVRMVSLVFGLLLLAAVYTIANRLRGQRFGLLSVSLVSMSGPFFYSAHLARHDILAAALGFWAVALYLNSPSWWADLLSGLCAGLAFEIHPHSAIYGPAIVALYFSDWRWSTIRQPRFWSFVAGVSIGLIFYVDIHILPYPQTYFALNRLFFAPSHTPPVFTLDPRIIVQATGNTGLLLVVVYQLLVPLVVWSVVALAHRRSKADKTLLVLNVALVIAAILLFRGTLYYRAILLTPAIDMLVAALVIEVSQRPWQGRRRDYVCRALVWGLCAGFIAINLSKLHVDQWDAYEKVQSRINQAVQPDDSIMAPPIFWLGLYDHAYDSWEELVYYRHYAPDTTLEDALREFQPDILIIDACWDVLIADRAGDSPLAQYLWLPQKEIAAFLDRHAYLTDRFNDESYGQIRVYRVVWEER